MAKRVGRQRTVNVALGDAGEIALARLGDDEAVQPDLHFDDARDAVPGAIGNLARLDAPRGVGDIGILLANAGTKQLDTTPGTGGFDNRRIKLRPSALELFGNCGSERIDCRGADDADLGPAVTAARRQQEKCRKHAKAARAGR